MLKNFSHNLAASAERNAVLATAKNNMPKDLKPSERAADILVNHPNINNISYTELQEIIARETHCDELEVEINTLKQSRAVLVGQEQDRRNQNNALKGNVKNLEAENKELVEALKLIESMPQYKFIDKAACIAREVLAKHKKEGK